MRVYGYKRRVYCLDKRTWRILFTLCRERWVFDMVCWMTLSISLSPAHAGFSGKCSDSEEAWALSWRSWVLSMVSLPRRFPASPALSTVFLNNPHRFNHSSHTPFSKISAKGVILLVYPFYHNRVHLYCSPSIAVNLNRVRQIASFWSPLTSVCFCCG